MKHNALGICAHMHFFLIVLVAVILSVFVAAQEDAVLEEFKMDDAQVSKLTTLLEQALRTTMFANGRPNEEELNRNDQALGPGRLECISRQGDLLAEFEFGIQRKQAVSLRSLSKLVTSMAVMALQDHGLINVTESIGDAICPNSQISKVTLTELLSMSSKAMDGRANALRSAQLARRKVPVDFVGFPPLCDELGWGPERCVSHFICPLLAGKKEAYILAGSTKEEIDTAVDISCTPFDRKERWQCLAHAKRGLFHDQPLYMADKCKFACPNSECVQSVNNTEHEITNNTRWEYQYDAKLDRITKRHSPFVYDNYAYTVADAYVRAKTGMSLVDAVKKYVFQPLNMRGSLHCLGNIGEDEVCDNVEEEFSCLSPPDNVKDWFLRNFTAWRGGEMSPAWVSNTFFASAHDIAALLAGLLRNGTLADGKTRFLSQASVDYIFTQHNLPPRPMASTVGTQAFGLGIGYCEGKEAKNPFPFKYVSKRSRNHPLQPGISMCTSERTWSWGSSHGSRVSLIRDRGGVACFAVLNTPNIGPYPTRAHFVGHNMSAILRDVFV